MSRMLAVLLIATLTASVAQAQKPNTREGFWIGFGFGVGSVGFGGDVEDHDRSTSLSGYLRMGGTLSQKVLIGGESNNWVGSIHGIENTVGFLGGVVLFYPSATGSFYLKGGLGLVAWQQERLTGYGLGLSLGMGNEFRMGDNFSINLFLNAIASSGVEVKGSGNSTGHNLDPNLVQLGVGVGWH